ncbi:MULTISPECIES: hypothetical protein [Solidesulfovibrio]|jgi:hypothetical protein|uniref:hypothetical protein n=1 Tax=Solidesulfovibrio TaxID=2910984 RepID=UPI000497DBEA|nr:MULTISPECIES: hypothetical protein [Solidesulfovibrio]MEA5090408.1 hypothetical protein [Solidesulfovibrio sp.]HML63069.1 hypothetical protein [Solidesulfovibrio sp.]
MSQRIKDIVDVLYKLAVIAGVAVLAYSLYGNRGVGRYQYIANGELEYVMDTTTGVIYQGGYSMNHITGKESSGGRPKK